MAFLSIVYFTKIVTSISFSFYSHAWLVVLSPFHVLLSSSSIGSSLNTANTVKIANITFLSLHSSQPAVSKKKVSTFLPLTLPSADWCSKFFYLVPGMVCIQPCTLIILLVLSRCQIPICCLLCLFALHLVPAASTSQLLKFGTFSLQLFECVPALTLSVVILRPTTLCLKNVPPLQLAMTFRYTVRLRQMLA